MVRVHLSEYKDETSQVCHWHVPAAHYLESWGDTRSYDGTVTIMQPLIAKIVDQRGNPSPASTAIGSRVTGQFAILFKSGRTLSGEFEGVIEEARPQN